MPAISTILGQNHRWSQTPNLFNKRNPRTSISSSCPPAYLSIFQHHEALNERVKEIKKVTQNPKVLLRLASIYTKLGRSRDALDTYARIQQVRGPSTPMPWLQRPTSIPREVPHINANFTAALAARSNPASEEVKHRDIPLFNPSLLLSMLMQRMTTPVSSNTDFTGYTTVVRPGMQSLQHALLR